MAAGALASDLIAETGRMEMRAEFEMTESFTTDIDEDDEEPLVAEVRSVQRGGHTRTAASAVALGCRVSRA